MALFVMLNLFTWLKSKVNTHSFKIKLGETPPYSEVYVQGLNLENQVKSHYFLFYNLGRIDFLNLGVWFENMVILLLFKHDSVLNCVNGFLCDLGKCFHSCWILCISSREAAQVLTASPAWIGVLKSVRREGVMLVNDPQNGLNIVTASLIMPLR